MDWRIKNLLLQARRPSNNGKVWGYKDQLPLLTLLHFSDIHGENVAMGRVCDFLEEYEEDIDDGICTGDLVDFCWKNDFSFWEQGGRSKTILSCIGNHDVWPSDGVWNPEGCVSQEECYKRYFAPYVAHWGCVCQENKTFYYKDYPSQMVRLIVLNSLLCGAEQQEQLDWLASVLDDALRRGLHVVGAMHYPILMKKIPCHFSTLDRGDTNGVSFMDVYVEKVAAFKEKGGEFVVWLTGHNHIDLIGQSEQYPGQLCIAIDALACGGSNAYNDMERREGTLSQDLYNLVTIDTVEKLIKIVRIGSNLDRYLRKRETLCINYKTFEVIE